MFPGLLGVPSKLSIAFPAATTAESDAGISTDRTLESLCFPREFQASWSVRVVSLFVL